MELRLINAESNTGIDQLHRAIVEGSGKAVEQTSENVEETLAGAPLIVASERNTTSGTCWLANLLCDASDPLLRNQIRAVVEENKQALQHIQSMKLSIARVLIKRHKIDGSFDYGRLGDAGQVHFDCLLFRASIEFDVVQSLNQIPATIREQGLARTRLCDDFDNAALYYPTNNAGYYEIRHHRKCKWTLSHTCKARDGVKTL